MKGIEALKRVGGPYYTIGEGAVLRGRHLTLFGEQYLRQGLMVEDVRRMIPLKNNASDDGT